MKLLVRPVFVGIGQIMLQPCWMTGALFVLGVAMQSLVLAGFLLAAAGIGTVVAKALRYDAQELEAGLFGFNGALVGLLAAVMFAPSGLMLILAALGVILSTWIMHLFLRAKLPAYTAPFVLTGWLLLYLGYQLGLPAAALTTASDLPWRLPFGALTGVGQVLFQQSDLSALLFLLGLLCSSRRAAAAALLGSLCGGLLGQAIGAAASSGLYGYNGALAAIALSGQAPRLCGLGVVLTVPILLVFHHLSLPALTAPFVLATWFVLVAAARDPGRGIARGE